MVFVVLLGAAFLDVNTCFPADALWGYVRDIEGIWTYSLGLGFSPCLLDVLAWRGRGRSLFAS